MKTVGIIQARLGSSRLPLKSLVALNGTPIIDWVTDRVGRAAELTETVVATPDTPLDKPLRDHLMRRGVRVITGPENDVLARFIMAARETEADAVVRVCADNPFIWPEAIDRLVRFYREANCDYAYNHVPKGNSWPDGFGAEIVSRKLLEEIAAATNAPAHREHCLNYIWDNAEKFNIKTFDPKEIWLRRPELKLDVDTPDDFRRLSLPGLTPAADARDVISAWDTREKE